MRVGSRVTTYLPSPPLHPTPYSPLPTPDSLSAVPYHTTDFDYSLPPELIAQYPIAERGTSRLLVVRRHDAELEDRSFGDLTQLIPPGDLLVLNSTRVRHARFLGTRPSGAPAEVLLLHPGTDGAWIAIGRPGSAMKPGKRIRLATDIEVETVSEQPELYILSGHPNQEDLADKFKPVRVEWKPLRTYPVPKC